MMARAVMALDSVRDFVALQRDSALKLYLVLMRHKLSHGSGRRKWQRVKSHQLRSTSNAWRSGAVGCSAWLGWGVFTVV